MLGLLRRRSRLERRCRCGSRAARSPSAFSSFRRTTAEAGQSMTCTSTPTAGKPTVIDDSQLEDVLAADPVERLMEDSWESRSRRASGRELAVETAAAALFMAVAVPLALGPL